MSDDTLFLLPGGSEVSLQVVLPEGVNIFDRALELYEGRIPYLDLPLMDGWPAWGLRIIPRFPAANSTLWREKGVLLEIPEATCHLIDEDRNQCSPFWGCTGSINTEITVEGFTVGRFLVAPLEEDTNGDTAQK